jgi:uncharacterized repeat protein (TIGR01451 family)
LSPTLHLAKEVGPVDQYAGLPVTYTVVFGNDGTAVAEGVVVSDVLPSEVEYAWDDQGGTYVAATHELVWGPQTLSTDSTVTATVVVTIDAALASTTFLTNTVYLLHQDDEPLVAQARHQAQAQCVPVTGATIDGEDSGTPGTYSFIATYLPADATGPVVFLWENGDGAATSVRDLTVGTHTLAVTVTNCTDARATDTHAVVITAPEVCTGVTGVQLSLVTTGTIHPDAAATFSADVIPDDALKPYSYRLAVDGTPGDELTASDDPLTFTQSFTGIGTHTVEIAVWNCDMAAAEAVVSTLDVTVSYGLRHLYLPLVLRPH